tara:strand:+ start:130 stop:498 length:369 start_codon:yes stop_codon:yes gene_type:complete
MDTKKNITEFKKRTNKRTGAIEYSFPAKLISLGATEIANKKTKKLFRIATITFTNTSGNVVTKSAMCYEASYSLGLDTGIDYLTTLSWKEDGKPALLMSHLPASSQATNEDFAGLEPSSSPE